MNLAETVTVVWVSKCAASEVDRFAEILILIEEEDEEKELHRRMASRILDRRQDE